MKRLKDILNDITSITLEIEQNYPELYEFLDENPITIPAGNSPDIEVFTDFRDTLNEQLEKHKASHQA